MKQTSKTSINFSGKLDFENEPNWLKIILALIVAGVIIAALLILKPVAVSLLKNGLIGGVLLTIRKLWKIRSP